MRIGQLLGEPEPTLCRLFGGLPEFKLTRKTAFLMVDMVQADAAVGKGGFWNLAKRKGMEDEFRYYDQRLGIVVPNLCRLLEAFRLQHLEVIHGVSHGYTRDGRDVKRPSAIKPQSWDGAHFWGGDELEIIPELAPRPNEVVIAKTGTGFFGVTVIDKVLTNLGIENLVIGGVVTHQCVESTVRGAFDHGFNVVIVEDGCATLSEELHRSSLRALGDWFCKVRTTDDVLEEVRTL